MRGTHAHEIGDRLEVETIEPLQQSHRRALEALLK